MTRVEDVDGVLELGAEYDCPAIEVVPLPDRGVPTAWMPVIGDMHGDEEIGNPILHIHYDERFLTAEMIRLVRWMEPQGLDDSIFVAPIRKDGHRVEEPDAGLDEWIRTAVRRMPFRCVRTTFHERGMRVCGVMRHPGTVAEWRALEAKMIRKRVDPRCMRCPHKGMPLRGAEARGGVITCPGHTLQWREGTGELVPRYALEVRHVDEADAA